MKYIILLITSVSVFAQTGIIKIIDSEPISETVITVNIQKDNVLLDEPISKDEQCFVWYVSSLDGEGHFADLEEALSSELVTNNDIIYLKDDQILNKFITVEKSITIRSSEVDRSIEIIGSLYFKEGTDVVLQDLVITPEKDQAAVVNDGALIIVFGNLILNGAAYNNSGSIYNHGTIKINN